jgi:acyl-CoA thioester hydrolase
VSEQAFQWVSRIRVQFRDLDSLGHVNNAVYLSYLETARMDFWHQAFGVGGFDRMPYILGEVRVRFVAAARLRDELDLGIRVARVGTKSFGFEYRIRDVATGRTVVEASSSQVFFDYEAQRTFEAPAEFREAVERLARESGSPVS